MRPGGSPWTEWRSPGGPGVLAVATVKSTNVSVEIPKAD